MRYLSLFSGIGGFDLGFDRAGMECAGQVEIDDYCQKVLAKHWPDVKRMSDIREVKGDEFGTVDVICGGFPCQPHSLAGQRKGAADDRDLWPEYRRLIAAMRPAWVVGENVPGIRTTILDSVLSDLEHLEYTATALVVPACAFDAPHRRERVFIVAHAERSQRREGESTGDERDGETTRRPQASSGTRASSANGRAAAMAHAESAGRRENGAGHLGRYVEREIPAAMADADTIGRNGRAGEFGQGRRRESTDSYRWEPEPGVGRVANGVPARVDRLRALGNAVVPQVAEWLGRRIMEAS